MGLARLAALHGVATDHTPSEGVTVPVPETTVVAVLAALGVDASGDAAVRDALDHAESVAASRLLPPTVVLWREDTAPFSLPRALAELPAGTALRIDIEDAADDEPAVEWLTGRAEDGAAPAGMAEGTAGQAEAVAPSWAELPCGVHQLRAEAPDGRTARSALVVAPAAVPQPDGRSHGFLVQLYSLLSDRSWGMGDLGDLAELATWSGRALGAGFVQVNPLHAAVPEHPRTPRRTGPRPAASPTPSICASRTSPSTDTWTSAPGNGWASCARRPPVCAPPYSRRAR